MIDGGCVSEFEHDCELLRRFVDDPRLPVHYTPHLREFWISTVVDGLPARQRILYCPWCGARLPETLRSPWHAELAAIAPDDPPPYDPDAWVPLAYRSDVWWKERFDDAGRPTQPGRPSPWL